MFDSLDPYSVKSLRKKASITNEHFVKMLLEITADQLENGKIDKARAKEAVKYTQAGLDARKINWMYKTNKSARDRYNKFVHAPLPEAINYWIKAAEILNYKFVISGKIKPETTETINGVNQAQLESLGPLELVPNE